MLALSAARSASTLSVVAIESRCTDILFERPPVGADVIVQRAVFFEKRLRDLIHFLVRALRRKLHGDQELPVCPKIQRDVRIRKQLPQDTRHLLPPPPQPRKLLG